MQNPRRVKKTTLGIGIGKDWEAEAKIDDSKTKSKQ